jgi:hypothetical protein
MRKIIAIAAFAVLLAPAAGAEEVRLGIFGSVEYDDNLFNSEDNPIDDISIRTGPILGLRRSQGNFVYDLRYEPRFEHFVDGTADDAWDHSAFGRATWQITQRTSIEATNRFLITRSLNRAGFIADPAAPDLGPTTEIEVGRQRITRNLSTVGLEHIFTPRLTGRANFSYDIFRTNREDRFDSDVMSGSVSGEYVLRAQDRVGAGGGITYQNFMETDTQPGRETFFYRLFATWFHSFDPSFTLSVQGGPTFVDSSQTSDTPTTATVQAFPFETTEGGGLRFIDSSTCPTTDDGQPFLADRCGLFGTEVTGMAAANARNAFRMVSQADGDTDAGLRTTIFANIELQKRWEHFRALARFRRSDSTSSGVGQSTVLNTLDGRVFWEPTERWQFMVGGSWNMRESATDETANGIGLGPPVPVLLSLAPPVTALASPSVNLRVVESDSFVDVTTWTARFTARRYFGKQSMLFIRYLYVNQSFDGATTQREFENHRILLGVRLILDWIRL